MHTIVLATQKGGSGKTTLAIDLALAALQTGQNVRLIDTDNQQTLSKWQVRRGIAEPVVEFVRNAGFIERRLRSLDGGGVDLTIIDTASGMTEATIAAIRACDLCLIPARPTVADIEATAATVRVVRACDKPFAFVLNQTPVRGRRIGDAAGALGGSISELTEVLAQPFIAMRTDHQDALAAGLSVSEYAPSGKSADEVRSLWQWTQAKLNRRRLARAAFPVDRAQADAVAELATSRQEAGLSWDACL